MVLLFPSKDVPVQLEEEAAIPKRPSREDVRELLVKAREIIADEMEAEETDKASVHEPPTARPLALTRSQEATFESVEQLQAQLENLVEEESDGTKSKLGTDLTGTEGVAASGEDKQTSPVRCKSAGTIGEYIIYAIIQLYRNRYPHSHAHTIS